MSVNFEELDFRPTPMGVLSLRRRRLPGTEIDIYEIKLGDEYLMSSRFTVGRDRTGAARPGGAAARRISTSSSAASGSATPRKPRWKTQRCDR